ncbi:MAG: UDP-3-O-(3-hydroxymyristoyl)glucosamine N-acyltransferase [Oligoflexales bacterium]
MELTALAKRLNATVFIPPGITSNDPIITGVQPLETATPKHLSFLTQTRSIPDAQKSKAAAILCQSPRDDLNKIQLIHKNPYAAMAHTQQWLSPTPPLSTGVHDFACVAQSAQISETASIGSFCTIGLSSLVGDHTQIASQTFIGDNCKIGQNCKIGPHVSIMNDTQIGDNVIIHAGAILGADGFGFAKDENGLIKIPQNGHVVIEDHVEIGPGCTIDRATFHETRIGYGTKLDSQVHVAHNVQIGKHGILCGQTGIAGSTKIGDHFTAAGQTAIGQGIQITNQVTLGPRTGATKSIPHSGDYMGMPYTSSKQWMKQAIAIQKLPELLQKIQKLEQKIQKLEGHHG